VVTRRHVARHRDANAARQLRIEVQVGLGVVETRADRDQRIDVDGRGSRVNRRRSILVSQVLELLRKRGAPLDRDPANSAAPSPRR